MKFTFWWRNKGNKEKEGKGEKEEGRKEEKKRDILVGGLVSGLSEIGLTFFVYEESYEKTILILSEHRKHPQKKIHKLVSIKIYFVKYYLSKTTTKKVKRQVIDKEKVFTKQPSNKGLPSWIYKEFL